MSSEKKENVSKPGGSPKMESLMRSSKRPSLANLTIKNSRQKRPSLANFKSMKKSGMIGSMSRTWITLKTEQNYEYMFVLTRLQSRKSML